MEANYDYAQTEDIEKEIERLRAIIVVREQNAKQLFVWTEQVIGVSRSVVGIHLSLAVASWFFFALVFFLGFGFYTHMAHIPPPAFVIPGALISAFVGFIAIGIFRWFYLRNCRVINEFQRRYPQEASLLGYTQ